MVSERCFASSVILHYYKGTMIGDSVVTNALHACDLLRNHCNYKNLSSYSPLQLTYKFSRKVMKIILCYIV